MEPFDVAPSVFWQPLAANHGKNNSAVLHQRLGGGVDADGVRGATIQLQFGQGERVDDAVLLFFERAFFFFCLLCSW